MTHNAPRKPLAPLVFFGNERLATGVDTTAPTLQALIAAGYPIAAVVANYRPQKPSRTTRPLEIEAIAARHNIPLLLPPKLSDIQTQLAGYHAQAGVLVAYGKIIPPSIIDLFPYGIINVHPSLLPAYRGSTPIETAILNGDAITGVTLMQIEAGLDTGPTYASETLHLTGAETKPQLTAQLSDLGAHLLISKLPAILNGTIVPIPQDSSGATYTTPITKSDGHINWHQPAAVIERQIRAYLGWPGSRTHLGNTEVIITAAHATPQSGPAGTAHLTPARELAVYGSEGSLIIDELKPAGKRAMTAAAFLAGHPLV